MKKYILLFLFAFFLIGSYYFVFSKDEWEGKRTFSPTVTPTAEFVGKLTESDIEQLTLSYLPQKALTPEFNGKVFCSHKLYGYEQENNENKLNIYVHAYCEEYYLKNEEILIGSGVSCPVKLIFSTDGKLPEFLEIVIPKEGDEYAQSIREIYPQLYVEQAIKGIDVSILSPSPEVQAENYFKGKLEVYF